MLNFNILLYISMLKIVISKTMFFDNLSNSYHFALKFIYLINYLSTQKKNVKKRKKKDFIYRFFILIHRSLCHSPNWNPRLVNGILSLYFLMSLINKLSRPLLLQRFAVDLRLVRICNTDSLKIHQSSIIFSRSESTELIITRTVFFAFSY